jgi:hypothetical protein
MSVILSAALFASFASAQMTTSAWMPGLSDSNMTFIGSVISANKDRTTLSIEYQSSDMTDNEMFSQAPKTVTLGSNTYVGFEVFQEVLDDGDFTMTISAACSRTNTDADATCVMSTSGIGPIMSALCAEGEEADADYCTQSGGLEIAVTTTLPADYFGTFPLVITAGEDKLSASAAATPSPSGASMTSGSSGSAAASASSGSGTGSATGTGPSATGAASSSSTEVAEATGAAPMMTMAPALAGLGAAAAAFFL